MALANQGAGRIWSRGYRVRVAFDVARVRGLVPALGDGWLHVDAAPGIQVSEHVVHAVSTAMRAPVSGPGGGFPSAQRAEVIEDAARAAVADLVGADPRGVVLGPGPEVLLRRLAEALSETWMLGDGVVLSRLDDVSNTVPWLRSAHRRGAVVRWAEIEIETCELPAWQFDELVGSSTRVITLTAASAQVGTCPPIPEIGELARRSGALLIADASALAPFEPLDIDVLGADVLVLSAAAWGGPHVGALVFRAPALLDRLPSLSLDAAARGPRRLELGPHSYPQLAGLVASVDYLAQLDDVARGGRRQRLLTSMRSIRDHQAELLAELIGALRLVPGVNVLGDPARRVPMLSLTHESVKAADLAAHLTQQGVCAYADPGDHGVLAYLGSAEIGGVVRIGLAHYNTSAEVRRLAEALESAPPSSF